MQNTINYGQLMHKAMRGLLADVLSLVAENGLPGEHHFYISFDTRHPGVDMSSSLKERYKEDMTIVFQEWFDDLTVMDDRFSVVLNFGDVPEKLVIPFDAVQTFVDPSVEFGLRFDPHEEEMEDDLELSEEDSPEITSHKDAEIVSLDSFRKK